MSSPHVDPDDLELGQTIRGFVAGQKLFGRYSLARILGRGGMGVVWLARDEKLNRDVALKFVPELVMHDRATLDDLKRETNRCLDLTHHNIVRIYDFIGDAQSACISMEFVDGPTLSALRVERPSKVFEVEELAPWIKQACDALDYAHNHARIVHCDLKPANLMLNSKGDLKVADFGIARSLNDSVTMLTMDRGTSGTLVYMSPQQLDGERPSHLDDIYSLGATLYELLTSRPPFYRGGVERQIHEKTPPFIAQRRQELHIASDKAVTPQWQATIAACLAKDPTRRPQGTAEIAKALALESISATSTAAATVATPSALASTQKHRKAAALAIAGLAALIISAVGYYFWLQRSTSQPQQSVMVLIPPAPSPHKSTPAQAAVQSPLATSEEAPYENSLGMKFVPVSAINVLFSIWETRVKDYKLFVETTKREWPKPSFRQTEEHPAVNVSWEDATAFCEWLTELERKAGRISAKQSYRLPSDEEWSAAVGLKGENGKTPKARDMKAKGVYPWGTTWPPPNGAGNYDSSLKADDYGETSPVGSFEANGYGIHDLGGNVWEWCQDWYDEKKYRVLRGASWINYNPDNLLSSCRQGLDPKYRDGNRGFRCVVEIAQSPPNAAVFSIEERLLKEATLLRDRGDTTNALARLHEAAQNDPLNANVLAQMAMIYEAIQLFERSNETWRKIQAIGPSAGALYELADMKLKKDVPPQVSPLDAGTTRNDADGIPAGSTFGITEVTATDGHDPDAETNMKLKISVKVRPNTTIDHTKVKIQVFFYDTLDNQEAVLTDSDVSYEWLTPHHNWANANPEVLAVTYLRPKQKRSTDLPGGEAHRKYLGYIVRIYYLDELQAVRADPTKLLNLFPPPFTAPVR